MRKRNSISPNREIVSNGAVDVVGSGEADYSREERPGTEDTARERLDGQSAICVQLRGVIGGRVGL